MMRRRSCIVKISIFAAGISTIFIDRPLLAQESEVARPEARSLPQELFPKVTLSGAFTQFLGAAVAGDGAGDPRFGGRVDLYASVAVSERTSLNLHPEFVYGKNVNNIGDGSILPLNTAMLLPSNGSEDFDLSANITQKIGTRASLTFGKINLLDLVAKTPIIGGGGLEGFQHISLSAPPSGLVSPSLLGAMVSVPTKSGIFGFWVFDPANQTNKTGFENPFSTGVTFLASATFPVKIGGKSGYQNLKFAVSTKTGTNLQDLPELLLPPGTTLIGKRKGAWNINYSFQQYLWENPNAKGKGWGVFGQIGLSDGNPTPLDWSGLIGFGGNPWTSRPNDRFGVAYFRQSFSNVLAKAVAPLFVLSDEQGLEAYYTTQIAKILRLTADVQIIDPAGTTKPTTMLLGVRAKVGF